nr:MAG TPA: hypothetical protein [Caudoviricetes sp.]
MGTPLKYRVKSTSDNTSYVKLCPITLVLEGITPYKAIRIYHYSYD